MTFLQASQQLGITVTEGIDTAQTQQVSDLIKHDYANMFKKCCRDADHVIYLHAGPEIALYHANLRSKASSLLQDSILLDQQDLVDEFDKIFFNNGKTSIESTVWDLREYYALNARPTAQFTVTVDFKLPHLWIDCRSFWNFGENTIQQIMNYVELDVDPSRLSAWIPIYYTWQKQQIQHLNFCYTLPHIIDSIINNWDYSIENLSFEQEVIVQHFLIYQHNLNLRNYQLDKFPNNAKDLHKLLESNIHIVKDIY
jgi:hypothetical protein